MSLYIRVFTNFYTNRKTMRLRAELGDDAFWIPPRLWAYAADNQPDGDFSSYSDQELSMLIGYSKDATSMLEALKKAGFLDADRKIHDWEVYNSYHRTFSERAKNAANAKWRKEKKPEKKEPEKTGNEMSQASVKDASSIRTVGNVGVSVSMRRPRNVEEVIAKGQFIGLGEPECRQWFIDCEACNWVRGDGSPFDNWPRQLCIHRDKLRSLPHQPNGKPVSGADIRMAIQMKEERAREIKERWSTDGPVSTDWNNEEKKQEFFSLKKEIKQLKAKAERLVS